MAETLVLDTNIVSYLMKGHPLAEAYRSHLDGKLLAISFMEKRVTRACGVGSPGRGLLGCWAISGCRGGVEVRNAIICHKRFTPAFWGR